MYLFIKTIIVIICVSFISCSTDLSLLSSLSSNSSKVISENDSFMDITLPETVVLSKIQSSFLVTIRSNVTWNLKSDVNWIIFNKNSGVAGVTDIVLSITNNTGEFDRIATINLIGISAKIIAKKVIITQTSANFEVSVKNIFLNREANSIGEIILTGDTDWVATVNSDWLEISSLKGNLNNNSTRISIRTLQANGTRNQRNTIIRFQSDRYVKEVNVFQNAYQFTTSTNSVSLGTKVNYTTTLELLGDASWTATKAPADTWYQLSSTQGSLVLNNPVPISIKVLTENTTGAPKLGTILFRAGDISISVVVRQVAGNSFIVQPENNFLLVEPTATQVELQLRGDTTWVASKEDSDNWYSLVSTQGIVVSNTTSIFRITINSSNTSNSLRQGSITFTPAGGTAIVFRLLHNANVDVDHDGLIEINSIERLNNMRLNLLGTGYKDNSINGVSDTFEGATGGCPTLLAPIWVHNNTGIIVNNSALAIPSTSYTQRNTCYGYELVKDLQFNQASSYQTNIVNGIYTSSCTFPCGWSPIGTEATPFQAYFNGNNFRIENVFINRSVSNAGFLGFIAGSVVISNVSIYCIITSAGDNTGCLAGRISTNVRIENTKSSGSINITNRTAGVNIGGLVGYNVGTIFNSASLVSITIGNSATGTTIENIGGFVGQNIGQISDSSSTGIIQANKNNIGGFVGYNIDLDLADNKSVSIINSVATGSITTTSGNKIGGFVGYSNNSKIENSYSTGSVNTQSSLVGGFVGQLGSTGIIQNCYSQPSSVSGTSKVGGFAGEMGENLLLSNTGIIINTYFAGSSVTGTTMVGGFVGSFYNNVDISNSLYNSNSVTISGTDSCAGSDTNRGVGVCSTALPTGLYKVEANNLRNGNYPIIEAAALIKTLLGGAFDYANASEYPTLFKKDNILEKVSVRP